MAAERRKAKKRKPEQEPAQDRPEKDPIDASAEQGRSDSDAAPSSRRDAPRSTPDEGEQLGDAPESGTREANEG